MFCSACGTQIQDGLNYCSRCGKRIAETDSETASIAESLSSSLGYVGGGGFIAYAFVILILVKNGVPSNVIVPITLVYFAALFGICFLILRQTHLFSTRGRSRPEDVRDGKAPFLRPVTTARLREARDAGVASVTEHTTRTLDEVPVERR